MSDCDSDFKNNCQDEHDGFFIRDDEEIIMDQNDPAQVCIENVLPDHVKRHRKTTVKFQVEEIPEDDFTDEEEDDFSEGEEEYSEYSEDEEFADSEGFTDEEDEFSDDHENI